MMIESILNAYSGVSAYEVAEDLQIVAEKLGQEDEGWKMFATILKHLNTYTEITGEFPVNSEWYG